MISFPNAKINLGLVITKKRLDGFHDIESCFYPVNWCDVLEIIPSKQTSFSSSGIKIPGNTDGNLCLRVYQNLKEEFDLPPIQIHLHKHIPIGAGMGGGSSDAAFTMKMLNTIFELSLSESQMEERIRPIGSDCAFFIKNKPVIAFGKGDQFESTSLKLSGHFLVIVYPEIHISTKEAYEGITPLQPVNSLTEILSKKPEEWKSLLVNDFEKSLFLKYKVLGEIKEKLYSHGAVYASMTGSGSAIYGLFPSKVESHSFFKGKYKVWGGLLD